VPGAHRRAGAVAPSSSTAATARAVVLAGVGTVLAGVGFGASALAVVRHAGAAGGAGGAARAYVAFSLPAVVAGLAATSFGLHATAVAYGLVVVLLGGTALIAQRVRRA